jgi:Secretion system C-terminal sorting domain
MKKIVLLLFLFTGIVNAQIVNIPDANFKAKLIDQGYDLNSDGEIQQSEALAADGINVSNANISDLTGIDAFGNIQILNCSGNQLTQLDVSGRAQLLTLYCNNNQISDLNITNCPNLDNFDCSNNLIPSLDFTGTTQFAFFYCNNNSITDLIFTNVVFFNDMFVGGNLIQNLDLSKVIITSSFADFSFNPLQTINLKNGYADNLSNFTISSPLLNLQHVCTDDNEITTVNNYLAFNGIAGVVVNSYCSFPPGGDYNTITGSILFDANNTGCDASDLPQPNIKININDGTNHGATFTNNSGNYNFYTQTGSFDVTPDVENPSWFSFSPTTATIPFANNNNNVVTQNFCITANGIHPNVEIVIAPITPARPAFDALYQIVYKNIGNQSTSGTIDFSYNDAVLDFILATVAPNGSGTGILNWNYTNLLPFENRTIYVTLNVNSPQETPPVNIGDQLYFTTSITSSAGDEIVEDNFFGYQQTVVGSYDPNDVTCIEGNMVPPSEIGEYLHYVINFENTGTAEAENVVVRTDIDATQFDVNSLQMLNTSHDAYIRQTGATIEFIFEGIYLDTGGHGNVLLKIKSLNNLQEGDTVAKQANIFFDYNFPIVTNMANTTFQILSNSDFEIDKSISVYPNPTNSIVTINCSNSIQSVQLYDVQGRLLQTQIINNQTTTVDLSQQSNGIYFVKVISENGIKVEKILKN